MNFSLEWVQIILTAIATGALVWTLIYVAQYTKATKGMADAAQASTEAALKAEEIRRQPVVQISVDPERQKEFYFRTVIANNGIAHAKLRILATIKVNAVNLVLTKDHLYNGERIWNLHAGHGIIGHLDFEGVFEHNKLHESLGERDNVIVTLTLWVINYNDSVESLYSGKVRMPVLSYEWSGSSAKDAQGQWVPDPAAELFDDELQADQK